MMRTQIQLPDRVYAEAKRIAEEVFAKQGNKGLGADGFH